MDKILKQIPERFTSRKFLVAVGAAILLWLGGDQDSAIEVVKFYVGAQGAVDIAGVLNSRKK